MKLVSVIIPTYNREVLLPRAINSVLTQTYGNFELLIIDDGSTDSTEKLIHDYMKKDSRVKYYKQNNQGESSARNLGVSKAKGDFIAFLDSDDEYLPEKIEKQLSLFKNSKIKNLGLVGSSGIIRKGGREFIDTPSVRGPFLEKILERCFVFPTSLLIKREAVVYKKFDIKIKQGPDWDMWIQIAEDGFGFDFASDPLYKYYFHEESITKKTSLLKKTNDLEYIFKKHKDSFLGKPAIYQRTLRHIGKEYILASDIERGRYFLKKALKINDRDRKARAIYLFSFLNGLGTLSINGLSIILTITNKLGQK